MKLTILSKNSLFVTIIAILFLVFGFSLPIKGFSQENVSISKEPSENSLSSNQKIFLFMLTGAIGGAVYGNQRESFKSQNGLLYAGLGAATAGALGLFLFSDHDQIKALQAESRALSEKLSSFERAQAPELISEGKNLLSSPLPKDVSKLINPGQWRRYKIDYWVQDPSNPYVWFRQNEMFEVIPPGIN